MSAPCRHAQPSLSLSDEIFPSLHRTQRIYKVCLWEGGNEGPPSPACPKFGTVWISLWVRKRKGQRETHTHTDAYIYIHVERERERRREREKIREREKRRQETPWKFSCTFPFFYAVIPLRWWKHIASFGSEGRISSFRSQSSLRRSPPLGWLAPRFCIYLCCFCWLPYCLPLAASPFLWGTEAYLLSSSLTLFFFSLSL